MEILEMIFREINKTVTHWLHDFAANLPNLMVALILIFLFYIFQVMLTKWIAKLLNRTQIHASLKLLLVSVTKIFVMIFGVFFALGIVGLDKTVVSLMAGVGVVGLALGFAFKDLASNLISGLFIAIQNPFDIGDEIKINKITGKVEMIRLRDTILNAGNGQKIYIPNKSFMEDALYNLSQTAEKRFDLNIGVSYDDDLELVIATLQKDLAQVENTKANRAPLIKIKEFTSTAVMLEINMWIDVPGVDITVYGNKVMIAVKNSLQKNNFHIPLIFNQNNISTPMLNS